MTKRKLRTLAYAWHPYAVAAILPMVAWADSPPGWNSIGSNTLRAEYYHVDGDASQSPWTQTGAQLHDAVDLLLWRRLSPWESQRLQLSGLVNDSDYRADRKGGILERASFFWEKGDSDLPFRLQAGDFYASQTPATIQLGLKGLQAEVQPSAGQSIQLFSGLPATNYRDLGSDKGVYTGLSWLQETGSLGAVNLTAVHYERDANASQIDLTHNVYSLAWYKPFTVDTHVLEFESELAGFSGEYDASGTRSSGTDSGFSAELSGRSEPLNYRLSYERYGDDFRPAGGTATPDHRAVEGHASWRFSSGLQLRGRVQSYRDSLETSDPLDTDVFGLSLSGPLLPGGSLQGSVDSYLQERNNRSNGIDAETRHLAFNLVQPFNDELSLRGGGSWSETHDRVTSSTNIKREIRLAVDAFVRAGAWRGNLSPGINLRRSTGNTDSTEVSPSLALNLSKQNHRVRFSHSWLNQDGHLAGSNDADIQQTALAYDFDKGQHRFGLEANRYDRDPDTGVATEAYRLSASWRYSFERPARQITPLPASASLKDDSSLPSLLELSSGQPLSLVTRRMTSARLTPAHRSPDTTVYEARLLDRIDLRQRLALIHSAGDLKAAVLVLDFSDPGNPGQMARDYARVRDLLLKQHGSPETYRQEGVFDNRTALSLAEGSFERMLQWRTGSGILRFGIPRRLDGQVRMEIRHAARMPADTSWGLDELR